MSTRSTIRFRNDGDSPVCCVYKHFDGYIEGLGHSLAEWLKGMTLINGISNKEQYGHDYANGIGCLAAKWIADNKTETGDIYMCSSDAQEDYNYDVILKRQNMRVLTVYGTNADDCIVVAVLDGEGNLIFSGSPSELLEFEENDG